MKLSPLVLLSLGLPSILACGRVVGDGREAPTEAFDEAVLAPAVAAELQAGKGPMSVLLVMKAQADLTSALATAGTENRRRVVVGSLQRTATDSQREVLGWLESRRLRYQSFYVANLVAVFDVSAKDLRALAARADVSRIVSNRPVRAALPRGGEAESFAPAVGPNIVQTGATKVWEQWQNRGEGIVVAGQDTGVDWNHPALKGKYRGFAGGSEVDHRYSWHDAIREPITGGSRCGYDTRAPCDDHGHGTHTLGTIVGDDGAGNQIGMAPGAQWIACRNMDDGTGRPSTYLECFEFFLAPYPQGEDPKTGDPSRGPQVINNSWGCDASEQCEGTELKLVLASLAQAGVMVVVSAGNEGPGCGSIGAQPATVSPLTLSVGAIDHRSGNIASFSSRGPSALDGELGPDLTAPGVSVRSSVPGGGYSGFMWSGTSMAGPHVAGAVALLWSANPSLRGQLEKTTEILRHSAVPKTTSQSCGGVSGAVVPNNTYGWGALDIFAAVQQSGR